MARPTANDFGPLVNVAAWISMAIMWLALSLKLYLKWAAARVWQRDDGVLLLAAAVATGQSVAIAFQVQCGLGQHSDTLPEAQLQRFETASYASHILYILSISLTKLGFLLFLRALASLNVHKNVLRLSNTFIALWMVSAVFAIAFGCGLPSPWNYESDSCINMRAFWMVNGVVDVLSQLLVAFMPVFLLYYIQIRQSSKLIAFLFASPNALTVPLTIIRLKFIHDVYPSSDLTWAAYRPALVSIVHANVAIVLACIPFFKPFIDALTIGTIGTNINFLASLGDTALSAKNNPTPAERQSRRIISRLLVPQGGSDPERSNTSAEGPSSSHEVMFRGLLSRSVLIPLSDRSMLDFKGRTQEASRSGSGGALWATQRFGSYVDGDNVPTNRYGYGD